MSGEKSTRRRFLVAAIAGGLSLPLISISSAWAASADGDAAANAGTLGRMARLLYPHASVPDAVYAQLVDEILSAAATDKQLSEQLDQAATALDQAGGIDFMALDDEAQLAVLTGLQHEPFFEAVRAQVMGKIYTHPRVWEVIGYPGSSVQLGGYKDRGFNDIDWLPGES